MTPAEIDLARRIIACGLPAPAHRPSMFADSVIAKLGNEVVATHHNAGSTDYDPATRILWQVVTTDTGPELLPVLEDYALLGWLITEARRRLDEPHLRTRWSKSGQRWEVYGDSAKWRNVVGYHAGVGETEVAALVAALEAAK